MIFLSMVLLGFRPSWSALRELCTGSGTACENVRKHLWNIHENSWKVLKTLECFEHMNENHTNIMKSLWRYSEHILFLLRKGVRTSGHRSTLWSFDQDYYPPGECSRRCSRSATPRRDAFDTDTAIFRAQFDYTL